MGKNASQREREIQDRERQIDRLTMMGNDD